MLGAALAGGVEMVEAVTIVLALGMSRGWRAPLLGSAVALAVLTAATIALGPALERIPIDAMRLVMGTLVLLFGLQWLRKAILREAGLRRALGGVLEFVVGDDVWTAVVVLAVIATGVAVQAGLDGWWVLPLAVPLAVLSSLRRASGA